MTGSLMAQRPNIREGNIVHSLARLSEFQLGDGSSMIRYTCEPDRNKWRWSKPPEETTEMVTCLGCIAAK